MRACSRTTEKIWRCWATRFSILRSRRLCFSTSRADVIENYMREVHRLLRPGGLFKFQVQGDATLHTSPDDTWLGVPFSDEQIVKMAERCGFEPRYRHGAGTQYFWIWYFKRD